MKLKSIIRISLAASLVLPATSCEKALTVQSENQISEISELIQSDEDARNVLNGAYDVLVNVMNGRIQNLNELRSSNAAEPNNNNDLKAVYDRSTNFFNSTINGIYQDLYLTVFRTNLLLDYIETNGGGSAELEQIANEARFLRAMAHFWVLKTYAQPYGYTPDNSHPGIVIRSEPSQLPIGRSSVADCYAFIQDDLISAYNGLPESNGFYADKYAAASLLAYTYFLQNNFSSCVEYCNAVVNSGKYSLEPSLDSFHAWTADAQVADNPEFIFGSNSILAINDSRNSGFTGNYRSYSLTGATLSLSLEAYNLFSQNGADLRNSWVQADQGQYQLLRFGTSETNQLGINFFDMPFLRLTVIKLIRAESLAELNTDLGTAIQDINDIRNRAFLPGTNELDPGISASEIIEAARLEFRKETIGEGLYVDQERRRGANGENIMIRNAPWDCPGMALQFPNSEGTGVDFVFNAEGGCN